MSQSNITNLDANLRPKNEAIDPKSIKVPTGSTPQEAQDQTPVARSDAFNIDHPLRLNPEKFPDQDPGNKLPATIANTRHMLSEYGILPRYDVIKKRLQITIPGASGSPDNADNTAMTHVVSLAILNNLPHGQIPSYVEVIGDMNQINPVAEWITSKIWDGVDRLQALYDTLEEREDFPKTLKEILLRRWLLSAVAAALLPTGFRARGVLTLQGPQSIGKTGWIRALVSDPILRDAVVKLDHHLDAGSKDSQINAICHWIVEVGELDSSFKKDIARLKGFITSDRDKIRRPYARSDSEYQRRTVFSATVNDQDFLVDDSGNTRWWTIPVTAIDYEHGIDMQQVFAQLAIDFDNGDRWWLMPHEEQLLEEQNRNHRRVSAIRERLMDRLDLDMPMEARPALTSTEVLRKIGISTPTNVQCKECCAALKELFGESKRIRGSNTWRVPLREYTYPMSTGPEDVDDDEY